MSEEMRRLREKLLEQGPRPLTGSDLAKLISEVDRDIRAASNDPSPYDAAAARHLRQGEPRKKT
ncbi:MAG: hypothetical protein AAB910_01390 [Patescibacteria group bacterium]